jgi:CheY-like chemotaxis protein
MYGCIVVIVYFALGYVITSPVLETTWYFTACKRPTLTFKAGIEENNNYKDANSRIEVYTSNDPVIALSEFKPNFYDLLLADINMPHMNGFELCEKILL